MPIGTKFAPSNSLEYGSKSLNADMRGVLFTATAGTSTSNDLLVSNDSLIDGAILIVIGASLGDTLTAQVVDVDNMLGYGAGTVLGQYLTSWYMNPNESFQLEFTSPYPAKLFGGLYLRMTYTSVGSSDVSVIINYKLHKVLW
jgi:hypothetical protein